jgi:hypothetical protein
LRSIDEIRRMPVMAKAKGKFRDRLLGIIVRVRIGDKVVKTYSTNNHLLDLEPSRLEKGKK